MFVSSRFRVHWLKVPLLCAVAVLGACRQVPSTLVDNRDQAPARLPSVPAPEPPIDRSALLAAVAQAASAIASGQSLPDGVRTLDGRQFELRIRFGCRGPSSSLAEQSLGWSFDPESRRLRVRAKPTISEDEALVMRISGEGFESVEGFWIPRPWLLQPVCPAAAALRPPEPGTAEPETSEREDDEVEEDAAEPAPAAPRIGIAQFFTRTDARTRRRDSRPYEAAKTLSEDSAIPSQGFDLVLSGRLRALPGKGPIDCVSQGADSPPECIVSAQFQRVWIEEPTSGEVYAEWGGG